jgi:hypothetical protein
MEHSSKERRRAFQDYTRQCAEIVAVANKSRRDDEAQWAPLDHPFPRLLEMFNQDMRPSEVRINQWCVKVEHGIAPQEEDFPPFWVLVWKRKAPTIPCVRLMTNTGQKGVVTPIIFTQDSLATVLAVVLREIAPDANTQMIAMELLQVHRKKIEKSLISQSGSLEKIEEVWKKWPKGNSSLCKALAFAALQWKEAIGLKALKRMVGSLCVQHGGGKTRYATTISVSEGNKRDKELDKALHATGDSVPTTYVGIDCGKGKYTIGGVTPGMADILRRQMSGAEVSALEQQQVENAKTHLGGHFFSVEFVENLHQKTRDERERAKDLKVIERCLARGGETLRDEINGRMDFVHFDTEGEILAAIKKELLVRDIRRFVYGSSVCKRWERKREILEQRVTGVLKYLLTTQLPDALNAAAPSLSLAKNLPTPPVTAANRRKQQRKGKPMSKLPRAMVDVPKEKEEADSVPPPRVVNPKKGVAKVVDNPPRRVRVAIDFLEGKGQKNTSTFAYVEELMRLKRLVRRDENTRKTLILHEVNSHRTTMQAQPTLAIWKGEAGRMDRTNPRPEDIPSTWVGPAPNTFKVRYDPLLRTLVNRDNNVPTALAMIDIALHNGIERPNIFCRFSKARTTSGGGVDSHI